VPFELFVALRYLTARRKQAFISLISAISTLGVAVGVTALVIALALMTGLQGELRNRILGSAAHIYVSKLGGISDPVAEAAKLRAVPGVLAAAPVAWGKALMRTEARDAFITLKGIDPVLEASVTELGKAMRAGSLAGLREQTPDGLDGVVIGEALARDLGAYVGDVVTVLTPEGTLSPMGVMPRARRLKVVGTFSLGLYEYDQAFGFVSLPVVARLLNKPDPDFMELRVDDIYRAPAIAANVMTSLGKSYLAQDWTDLNQSLFSALWLEKMAISITIGLIVMVAALNIIASLVLLVMEKSRDIAILKTMGASARSIMVIFILQGVLIGVAGTAVGAALGRTLAYVLDRYKLIQVPTEVYQVAYVPFKIDTSDFLLVILAALLICFAATIYPSRQASRLDPAEALRYQ